MAKKKEKEVLCAKCKFFTDKCEHKSNLNIIISNRLETVTYKSLEPKTECECFQIVD